MPLPPGRRGRPPGEPATRKETAWLIAAQLKHMIERADGAELKLLSYLLECAMIEAEKRAADDADRPH